VAVGHGASTPHARDAPTRAIATSHTQRACRGRRQKAWCKQDRQDRESVSAHGPAAGKAMGDYKHGGMKRGKAYKGHQRHDRQLQ